jgi:hypothetical protein
MRIRKRVNICLTLTAAFIFAFANAVNADDIVNNGDTDTVTVSGINSVDTINVIDTINTANAVNTVDAIGNIDNDSSAIANKRQTAPKINDDPPPLSGAYWGFGIGLSVGAAPIFQTWQRRFPDTFLSPAFAADTAAGDANPLRYRVTESPDAFNFTLPLNLSLYSIGEKQVFSLSISFFRNAKEFQSTLDIADTVTRRIDILERLSYYSASIEAAARWSIPPAFFSIDGSQQTLLTIALGASPINSFTRESEIQTNFDDGDKRMRAAADSADRTFSALSGNGLSLSWRIGVSVIKRYRSGYGAEFGLFYSGAYSNRFYSEGVRLTEEHIKIRGTDLNSESVTKGKPLSFLSNQAEFKATLLAPANKK